MVMLVQGGNERSISASEAETLVGQNITVKDLHGQITGKVISITPISGTSLARFIVYFEGGSHKIVTDADLIIVN